jgi:RNA polymerase sigma factor (sigma-70 family)
VAVRPFEHVLREHAATVLRVCAGLVGRDDAEDACAETFLAALRAYPRLREGSNVRGWLVTIAHRKAVDVLRARRRAPRPVGALPDAAREHAAAAERDPTLERALASLTFRQRAAVTYHHVAGLPYEEVGALLGTSAAAARRSAADGIARLRARLRGVVT